MKKAVFPSNAPRPVAPYSPAIDLGDFVFTSGQIGLDPVTGKMVEGGVEAEAGQVFRNIEAVLAEAGLGLDDVVKTTVFMTDMGSFGPVNGFYEEKFSEPRPARSTVGVSALPLGAQVEIEVIARRPV